MNNKDLAFLSLRVGVAFAFLYPPIDALFHPASWLSFFPDFLLRAVNHSVLLHGFGLIELAIGLGLLLMRRPVLPAVAAACMLGSIVLVHWRGFSFLFRDVSILLAALALAFLSRERTENHT